MHLVGCWCVGNVQCCVVARGDSCGILLDPVLEVFDAAFEVVG